MASGEEDGYRLKKKKKLQVIGIRKSDRMLLHATSLASLESLSLPLEQEIVISADVRCGECQKRIAEIMSRMSETESIVVSVLEKKVALTSTYSLNSRLQPKPLNKMLTLPSIFTSRKNV